LYYEEDITDAPTLLSRIFFRDHNMETYRKFVERLYSGEREEINRFSGGGNRYNNFGREGDRKDQWIRGGGKSNGMKVMESNHGSSNYNNNNNNKNGFYRRGNGYERKWRKDDW